LGARREGKNAWDIAKMYTKDFLKGLDALGIAIPRDHLIRATDHIEEQITLVQTLEKNGHTYIIDDGVYFDTSTINNYGKLARLKLEGQQAGARVEVSAQKRSPYDFALWKFSPKNAKRDMEWDSPWGKGFPGWHIECSAMSMKYLGDTIDIHSGGIDHIPVHHTNEIAQSEAATSKPFVRYWVHNNFLTVDGTKISKSLGNGYTLQDILEKGFSPLNYRLFVLQSNYQTESNFTWEGLAAAQAKLRDFQAFADMVWQPNDQDSGVTSQQISSALNEIRDALRENLNTSLALTRLNELEQAVITTGITKQAQQALVDCIASLDTLLGLQLTSNDVPESIHSLLKQRANARAEKDWKLSDEFRDTLAAQNIIVRDTANGQFWAKIR
jgi:cysteinyl-tRNA synthetase